jgi:hypothetical protein
MQHYIEPVDLTLRLGFATANEEPELVTEWIVCG